mgnify:CR=1 FL=1
MDNANLLNLEIQVARARDFERMTVSSKVLSRSYALVCLSFLMSLLECTRHKNVLLAD